MLKAKIEFTQEELDDTELKFHRLSCKNNGMNPDDCKCKVPGEEDWLDLKTGKRVK